MLDDGSGAIGDDIADGDTMLIGGLEIDIIGAGGRQAN